MNPRAKRSSIQQALSLIESDSIKKRISIAGFARQSFLMSTLRLCSVTVSVCRQGYLMENCSVTCDLSRLVDVSNKRDNAYLKKNIDLIKMVKRWSNL